MGRLPLLWGANCRSHLERNLDYVQGSQREKHLLWNESPSAFEVPASTSKEEKKAAREIDLLVAEADVGKTGRQSGGGMSSLERARGFRA